MSGKREPSPREERGVFRLGCRPEKGEEKRKAQWGSGQQTEEGWGLPMKKKDGRGQLGHEDLNYLRAIRGRENWEPCRKNARPAL